MATMKLGTRTPSLRFKDRDELTAEKLREQVHYDPETGIFTWKVTRKGTRAGERVGGTTLSNGHPTMSIGGQRYLAARLAWLYVHGEWPNGDGRIKFVDGNPLNTRIDNLRPKRTKHEHYALFHERHPGRMRVFHLRRYDGMTEAKYMAMYLAQDGKCAACHQAETVTRNGKVRWLCVDHHHGDGHVRDGLLCVGCNAATGYAKDNPTILRALADRLEADERKQAATNIIPLKGAG